MEEELIRIIDIQTNNAAVAIDLLDRLLSMVEDEVAEELHKIIAALEGTHEIKQR